MTILFLTSCLEPGKDGVGDYTRLLAVECIRQNHQCYLLALNDFFVSQPVESIDSVDGISISTLRLPNDLPWKNRAELAGNFRERCSADWISLQFVCYGFNPKGVVRNMAPYFEAIVADRPLHVMFHETWIGASPAPSIKDLLVGRIQRHYIRELFARLKPRLATTSNPFYVGLLGGIGIPAVETPLFGNITVTPPGADLQIPEALIQAGICDDRGNHPHRWLGLFFGALYPDWKAEPFMSILTMAADKAGKRACLISAGRWGKVGETRWKKLQACYAKAVDFMATGECTPSQLSALFHMVDFGLATSPWHLLGKSGSTTAMLDHGLPVIVTNFDFESPTPSIRPPDPLLHRSDASLEAKLLAGLPRGEPIRYRLTEAAETLVTLLTKLSP